MNLCRCEKNGHFYDGDMYAECPHCGSQGGSDDLTEPLTKSVDLTESLEPKKKIVPEENTIGYYDQSLGSEPVVGWLVCVEGNNLGMDYRLKSGRNFIGRSQDMDVSIVGDDTVSRSKHAIVVYEPKTYTFLVQAGDSKELSYLNDKVVLNPAELKVNDIITIGNTKLMFIPCCNEEFNWEGSAERARERILTAE